MGDKMNKLVKSLQEAIHDADKKKTSAYDTSATVVRNDGDILWVHIPGGVDETPVRRTINAKPGDEVQVRVANGSAWALGNATNPPTDDAVAVEAKVMAGTAVQDILVMKTVVAEKVDVIEMNAVKATIGDLEAQTAKIEDLSAEQLTATVGYIDDLTAANITANDISSDHATIEDLDATYATIDDLEANYAHITNGVIDNATIGYADVNNLDTHYAAIDLANVNNAWIQNGLIKDAAIGDAQIIGVSANKLTAGTIDASNITVTNLNASNITTGTINGQRIGTGSLSLDKLSDAVYTETEIDDMLDGLQDQIDGAIETWTGPVVPTLNNYPASSWTTTEERKKHVGDIYYVVSTSGGGSESETTLPSSVVISDTTDSHGGTVRTITAQEEVKLQSKTITPLSVAQLVEPDLGYDGFSQVTVQGSSGGDTPIIENGFCYRFTQDSENQNNFSWVLIKDSDVTAALQRLVEVEGDISGLQTFETQTSSWITNTDDELESLKTRTTNVETSLGDKVSTSTFNTLSQTVDSNTASITSLSNTVQTKADSSTVTTLSNTVNTVSQTASTNSSKISNLTTVLGTNDDGTTKTNDIVHRMSAAEQDLDGFKTTVSETYQTKADMSGYSTTSQMNSALTRISAAESSITQQATQIQSKVSQTDFDSLTGRVSTAESTLTQHATSIEAKVSKDGVIASINASVEQEGGSAVKISANKVDIEGAAIFTGSGRLSTTSLNNAYDSSGKADKTDAIAEEQIIYIQAVNGTSSVPAYPSSATTTSSYWVTRTGESIPNGTPPNSAAQQTPLWTIKKPSYQSNYPVIFTAKQKKTVSGTITCSTPLKDDTMTIIDGGNITTGNIDANQLTVNVINAVNNGNGTINGDKITASSLEIGKLNSSAQTTISNAAKTASDYITPIDNNGITVHAASNPDSNYSKIDAEGLEVFQDESSVAKFGLETRIGQEGASRVELTADSISLVADNGLDALRSETSSVPISGIVDFDTTSTLIHSQTGPSFIYDFDSIPDGETIYVYIKTSYSYWVKYAQRKTWPSTHYYTYVESTYKGGTRVHETKPIEFTKSSSGSQTKYTTMEVVSNVTAPTATSAGVNRTYSGITVQIKYTAPNTITITVPAYQETMNGNLHDVVLSCYDANGNSVSKTCNVGVYNAFAYFHLFKVRNTSTVYIPKTQINGRCYLELNSDGDVPDSDDYYIATLLQQFGWDADCLITGGIV